MPLIAAATTTVAADEFADAMSTLANGVVLATCRHADRPWGMTVTAFVSVSASPPTVLVSLGSETSTVRAIAATGAFGVSILAHDQVGVAAYGAAQGAPKFLDSLIEPGERDSESPAVAHSLAHLDCVVVDAVEAADHTVLFGRVDRVRRRSNGEPLLYHNRAYGSFFVPDATMERNLRCISS